MKVCSTNNGFYPKIIPSRLASLVGARALFKVLNTTKNWVEIRISKAWSSCQTKKDRLRNTGFKYEDICKAGGTCTDLLTLFS